MPKIPQSRTVVEIELKHIEGGKISMYETLTALDVEKMMKNQPATADATQQGVLFPLSLLIQDWNIEAEDGSKLPITEENIGKLDARDLVLILKRANISGDFLGEAKVGAGQS
jgi:hypothetical protein